MIVHARTVVLTPDGSRDAIHKALVEVLDASLMILPKTDYADEFRSRIERRQGHDRGGELFSDKAYQYLGLAYKLVAGGQPLAGPGGAQGRQLGKEGHRTGDRDLRDSSSIRP